MARHKDAKWNLAEVPSNEHVMIAVLMDIRDELQSLRSSLTNANSCLVRMAGRLDCHETISIPRLLRRISVNTHKPKRKRAKKV